MGERDGLYASELQRRSIQSRRAIGTCSQRQFGDGDRSTFRCGRRDRGLRGRSAGVPLRAGSPRPGRLGLEPGSHQVGSRSALRPLAASRCSPSGRTQEVGHGVLGLQMRTASRGAGGRARVAWGLLEATRSRASLARSSLCSPCVGDVVDVDVPSLLFRPATFGVAGEQRSSSPASLRARSVSGLSHGVLPPCRSAHVRCRRSRSRRAWCSSKPSTLAIASSSSSSGQPAHIASRTSLGQAREHSCEGRLEELAVGLRRARPPQVAKLAPVGPKSGWSRRRSPRPFRAWLSRRLFDPRPPSSPGRGLVVDVALRAQAVGLLRPIM